MHMHWQEFSYYWFVYSHTSCSGINLILWVFTPEIGGFSGFLHLKYERMACNGLHFIPVILDLRAALINEIYISWNHVLFHTKCFHSQISSKFPAYGRSYVIQNWLSRNFGYVYQNPDLFLNVSTFLWINYWNVVIMLIYWI